MSATQDGRRRSARKAFDDEDTRPAKKPKTDDRSSKPSKQANGRKPAAAPKKSKASYDEDADGFTFARAKPKKAASKPAQAPQSSIPPELSTSQQDKERSPQPESKRGRPRKPSIDPQAEPQRQKTPPTRRSARLSGDQVQQEQDQQTSAKPNGGPLQEERRIAKTPGSADLRVGKKRAPTKIALPFADTPVITRNKEMRKESADGRRRSSSGMRGRRASSLIDSGTSNGESDLSEWLPTSATTEEYIALPHSEVETNDFYKHIHQDLSEPRRMKQLLVWCGTRALVPPRLTGTSEDVNAVLAARTIQEELLREFSNKNEMSDWFNREDISPTALVKKANPRNVQNTSKLHELELEVKRLKSEKSNWDVLLGDLLSSSNRKLDVGELDPIKSIDPTQIDHSALDQAEQATILSDVLSNQSIIESSRSRLKAATGSIEFKMDTLAEGVHKVEKLRQSSDLIVDRVLSQASSLLQQRDETASKSAGTEKVGIGDLLRSLSRVS